jgi:hypothetical protein
LRRTGKNIWRKRLSRDCSRVYSELNQSNPGGSTPMLGAFLNRFKARRSERSFSVLYVVKKIFSRKSLRNDAKPRDSRPRLSTAEMASTPGMVFGVLQPFNRTTAISVSVKIERSPLGWQYLL